MTIGPGVFLNLISDGNRSPGWMRRSTDGGFLAPIGNAHDHFFSIDANHLFVSLPGYATETTIRAIGRDRDLLLFPEETLASQIERCRSWLASHRDRGLPIGILRQIQLLWAPDVPRVAIVAGNAQRAYWHVLDSDGTFSSLRQEPSNWDWDSAFPFGPGDPATIHRFFVIVYAPPGVTPHTVAESAPFPGTLGSGQITHRMGLNIASLARYMARSGAILWGWILAFDPASFDPALDNGTVPGGYPDGTWYQAYIPGIGFNRLQTARYYELKSPLT